MNELTLEDTPRVLTEIEDAFWDIPFENSNFQTEAFVLAAQITPERAYRALGLRMHTKLNALKEAHFNRRLEEIQIQELREKIDDVSTSKWDKMRHEIEIQKILSGRRWSDKLINDALTELNCLYQHFLKLPRYTRDEFESGEQQHFKERLTRGAQGVQGHLESMVNMDSDLENLITFEKTLALQLGDQKQVLINNESNTGEQQ